MLSFSHLGSGSNNSGSLNNVYSYQKDIFIKSVSKNTTGMVEIFNFTGQKVAESMLNGSVRMNLNLAEGYYLVRVVTSQFTESVKVFIH